MATVEFTKGLYDEALAAIRKLDRIHHKQDILKQEEEEARAVIIAALNGNEEAKATIGGFHFTIRYKSVPQNRIDTKALRAKYPQIADECSKTSESMRFTMLNK